MMPLTIDTFITAAQDAEWSEYMLLAALKHYHDDFNQNKLYPAISELIEVTALLESLIMQKENIEARLPKLIVGVDTMKNSLIYGKSSDLLPRNTVFEFIRFSLPLLKDILEEANAIYEFVDENIQIREVGIIPLYREEGYLFVPDLKKSLLHILRFELSLFTSSGEDMRILKTQQVKEIGEEDKDMNEVKIDLIRESPEMPNPATYLLETDLDFPFKETILPIAKRRLMSHLAA